LKKRRIIAESLVLVIVLYFFQDGLYKIWNWQAYGNWLRNAPYLHSLAGICKYLATVAELEISFGLLFGVIRRAVLYGALISLVATMILVLTSCILSKHLIFPFHPLWKHATWFDILLIDLLLCWIIAAALFLERDMPVARP
jgi:uncharacterized membrane protein